LKLQSRDRDTANLGPPAVAINRPGQNRRKPTACLAAGGPYTLWPQHGSEFSLDRARSSDQLRSKDRCRCVQLDPRHTAAGLVHACRAMPRRGWRWAAFALRCNRDQRERQERAVAIAEGDRGRDCAGASTRPGDVQYSNAPKIPNCDVFPGVAHDLSLDAGQGGTESAVSVAELDHCVATATCPK
jgi:hypothetical protein